MKSVQVNSLTSMIYRRSVENVVQPDCVSFFSVILNIIVLSLLGYLKGGETLRLLHSHSDACLTIPSAEQGEELQRSVERTSLFVM